MSDPQTPTVQEPAGKTHRAARLALYIVLAFVFLFFAFVFSASGLMDVVLVLIVGWWQFLQRTVPRISWSWDLVVMGVLCATLVLFFAHRFLTWLTRSVAAAREAAWRWPWKWTWCGACAVALFFLIGMATGGIVHQVGWMASSREPWIERKRFYGEEINDMRQLDGGFQQALLEANGDVEKARRELLDPNSKLFGSSRYVSSLLESYHFLLIKDADGKLVGDIIFARDPRRRAKGRVSYWFGDQNDFVSADELPALIRKQQAHLVTLL